MSDLVDKPSSTASCRPPSEPPRILILVAEDDPLCRNVLLDLLDRWGYQNVAVDDGDAAYAILADPKGPPILALLDRGLPGLDGAEVCKRVRMLPLMHQPHILLVTALAHRHDVITGLRAGANDYICKPYDPEELLARIQVGERVLQLQAALGDRVRQLEAAMSHIHTLQGLLPLCSHCHRIRNDQATWQRLEHYLTEHADVRISHGLCPECLQKYYGEYLSPPTPADPPPDACS